MAATAEQQRAFAAAEAQQRALDDAKLLAECCAAFPHIIWALDHGPCALVGCFHLRVHPPVRQGRGMAVLNNTGEPSIQVTNVTMPGHRGFFTFNEFRAFMERQAVILTRCASTTCTWCGASSCTKTDEFHGLLEAYGLHCQCWSNVPAAWLPEIRNLCGDLRNLGWTGREVGQIKEKFGRLCFYADDLTAEMQERVAAAARAIEQLSP